MPDVYLEVIVGQRSALYCLGTEASPLKFLPDFPRKPVDTMLPQSKIGKLLRRSPKRRPEFQIAAPRLRRNRNVYSIDVFNHKGSQRLIVRTRTNVTAQLEVIHLDVAKVLFQLRAGTPIKVMHLEFTPIEGNVTMPSREITWLSAR